MGKAKRAHHLFAERSLNIAQIASPVLGQQPSLYIAMEAAMRPIGYARDVAMLHWIEMNVIDMPFEICLVSDGMLPIASLPNAFLSLTDLACGTRLRIDAS